MFGLLHFSTSQESSPVSDLFRNTQPNKIYYFTDHNRIDKYKIRNNKPKIKTAAFLYSE